MPANGGNFCYLTELNIFNPVPSPIVSGTPISPLRLNRLTLNTRVILDRVSFCPSLVLLEFYLANLNKTWLRYSLLNLSTIAVNEL
jgi:hypothetical protein